MKLIVGNWKLNGSKQLNKAFAHDFIENIDFFTTHSQIVICPPYVYIEQLKKLFAKTPVKIGAQNVSAYIDGAFTGEISAKMLHDLKCEYVVIGHSERRNLFHENNAELIKAKAAVAQELGLKTIICIGETLEIREKNEIFDFIQAQIMNSLPPNIDPNKTIIAYEPIWSIGTGITPKVEEIEELAKFFKDYTGNMFKLLYGGSVKSNFAKELSHIKELDGLLVGGASITPHEFIKIIQSA